MTSPRQRISRFLRARLQLPLLSLLVLALIPSQSLVFTLVPAWESLKTLLSRKTHRNNKLQLQQWLTYWLLLAGCRVLEKTRLDLSLESYSLSTILRSLPSFLLSKLALSPSPTSSPFPVAAVAPRKQSLAVKVAGSPTRWLFLKAVLLFFAMDKEIQGANWLLHKVAKPLVAFFTSIEEEPQSDPPEGTRSSGMKRSRRRDENIAYKLSDEEAASSTAHEQEEYMQTTPELSMDEADSSSSTSSTTYPSNGGSGDTGITRHKTLMNNLKTIQDPGWESNYWTA